MIIIDKLARAFAAATAAFLEELWPREHPPQADLTPWQAETLAMTLTAEALADVEAEQEVWAAAADPYEDAVQRQRARRQRDEVWARRDNETPH